MAWLSSNYYGFMSQKADETYSLHLQNVYLQNLFLKVDIHRTGGVVEVFLIGFPLARNL